VSLVSEDAGRLARIDRKFNEGDFDYTVRECSKYVEAYPGSFKGWGLLGWAYVKTDQLEKAQESFDKSLSLNPKWDNAHVGRGAMHRKKGDNNNARKSYLEAIKIVPDNAEAYCSLVVIELMESNDKKAVEYGEKAWSLRKDLPSIPAICRLPTITLAIKRSATGITNMRRVLGITSWNRSRISSMEKRAFESRDKSMQ